MDQEYKRELQYGQNDRNRNKNEMLTRLKKNIF